MNSKVQEIGELNFRGNVIDDGWFHHIKTEAGKPHMLAIMILGDIVYWYRPTKYVDEDTDEIEYRQKFKADKLQRNYQQISEKFGVSKLQAKRACDLLQDMNLIDIEFRTIVVNNTPLNNVMFVEPVPEEIKKISSAYQKSKDLLTKKEPPSLQKSKEGPYEKVKTYTEITTDTTTNKKEDDDIPRHPIPKFMQDTVYAKVLRIYQENIGDLPPIYQDEFGEFLDLLGEELIVEAIKRAAGKNKRFWRYIESTLMKWKNNQCRTLVDVKALDDQQKGGGMNATHRSGYGSYSPASRSYAEEDANRRRSMPSFIKRV